MKRRLVVGVNLLLGAGLLVWVLAAYGAPALQILGAGVSYGKLALFAGTALGTIALLSWRWGLVLGGVGAPPPLARLLLFRSAAHTLAVLVPSGKVGGDPLRAWLLVRERVAPGPAISSTAVDRALELATNAPFSVAFALLLLRRGIPQLERGVVFLSVGALTLAVGLFVAVRRLRRGAGLVAPLFRRMRLDQLAAVERRMDVLVAADASATELIGRSGRLLVGLAAGLVANLLVVAEFALLLAAFDLPVDPIAVVAAIFATGAAHTLPIPAGLGVLEGANLWLFHVLGYPSEVGLAVGLAARLRELLWMLPGTLYLLFRSVGSSRAVDPEV